MKSLFALFIIATLSISACATANQTKAGQAPITDNAFQVKQEGDRMVATGCFLSEKAMWHETLMLFVRTTKQCPKQADGIGGDQEVKRQMSPQGDVLVCTRVSYPVCS